MKATMQRSKGPRRRLWVALLCILGGIPCIAQLSNIDSLENALRTERSPVQRMQLLYRLAGTYYDLRRDTLVLPLLDEAEALTAQTGDPHGLALVPMAKALRASMAGDHLKAIELYKQSIQKLDALGVEQDLAGPLAVIRNEFNATGQQEERHSFYTEALQRYSNTGLRNNVGICHHGLGGYYLAKRQFGKAVDHYMQAKEIFAGGRLGDLYNEIHVLGMVYRQWGNSERAEHYLKDALSYYERVRGASSSARLLISLGELEADRGDTARACAYFHQSWDLRDGLGVVDIAIGLSKLVQADLWQGHSDSARVHLHALNALMANEPLPLFTSAGNCEVGYTNYLFKLHAGDQDSARYHLLNALREAERSEMETLAQKYRRELAHFLRRSGDAGNALGHALAYMAVSDSLQALANEEAIATYEAQARERESAVALEQKQGQLDRQRLFMFAVAAIATLLAVLVIIVIRNNRQKQRANKEIDAARKRAEASEKFKQQFLANMSHEIRTPMNAIMGMTGILKRNEQLPEQRKYLDAIAQSSENLLVILNDILDLSKLEAGKIDLEQVAFDPRQVVGSVRDILRFKAEEKGLEVEVRVDDNVPRALLGDPTRLNQIVLNLAGNAIKFTEHGSVTITGTWSDGALSIAVTDTGIGIPQDRLDKIFEEFTQAYSDTTRKYGGTGLGLTISKRLAELQGGSIAVKSEQGKGSTFTVSIPYEAATSAKDGAAPGQARIDHAVELRDLKILLAEDNDFNAMVAQDELADAIPGVHVDIAANGKIAVEMVQVNDYDVILMDVQMPEMNGYDATKAIRALPGDRSRTPIVAMTANVMKEEVERCMEAGMDGYVPKPFKREELMNAIGVAMEDNVDRPE